MRGIPFSAGFRPFQPHEGAARLIKTFEHSLVPGLFQTRAYAQAIFEGNPKTTAEMVKERVDGADGASGDLVPGARPARPACMRSSMSRY